MRDTHFVRCDAYEMSQPAMKSSNVSGMSAALYGSCMPKTREGSQKWTRNISKSQVAPAD